MSSPHQTFGQGLDLIARIHESETNGRWQCLHHHRSYHLSKNMSKVKVPVLPSPPVWPPLVASWSCFEDSLKRLQNHVSQQQLWPWSLRRLRCSHWSQRHHKGPDSHLPPGPGPWSKPGTEPRMVSSLDDAMSWAWDFHDRAMEARGLDFGLCGFDQDVILNQHHSHDSTTIDQIILSQIDLGLKMWRFEDTIQRFFD